VKVGGAFRGRTLHGSGMWSSAEARLNPTCQDFGLFGCTVNTEFLRMQGIISHNGVTGWQTRRLQELSGEGDVQGHPDAAIRIVHGGFGGTMVG